MKMNNNFIRALLINVNTVPEISEFCKHKSEFCKTHRYELCRKLLKYSGYKVGEFLPYSCKLFFELNKLIKYSDTLKDIKMNDELLSIISKYGSEKLHSFIKYNNYKISSRVPQNSLAFIPSFLPSNKSLDTVLLP